VTERLLDRTGATHPKWGLRVSVLAAVGVVIMALATTPTQRGCGTLLSLLLLLAAWNTGEVTYSVATIGLTIAAYGVPLAASLALLKHRPNAVRILAVWAWTGTFLFFLLVAPKAHDCP